MQLFSGKRRPIVTPSSRVLANVSPVKLSLLPDEIRIAGRTGMRGGYIEDGEMEEV